MGLPGVVAAVQVLGSGLSAAGQYQAGQQQKTIYNRDATLARRAAIDAITRGASDAGVVAAEAGKAIGAARAAAAGSGVDVASGSVLDAITTTRAVAALDIEKIKNNALREALGYKAQADDLSYRGQVAAYQGRLGMVSTLLGGGSDALATGYSSGLFPKLGKGG